MVTAAEMGWRMDVIEHGTPVDQIPAHPYYIDRRVRARGITYRPCAIWFTGLPASGKSTIANLVEIELQEFACRTYILDGDSLRHGLNRDLGFSEVDRRENVRRVAEVARLMVDAGLIALVALVSPNRAQRDRARTLFPAGEFFEVFVDAPVSVAEARDPKGLYRRARRGEIRDFTGIDAAYEPPETPDIHLQTSCASAHACARTVISVLEKDAIIRRPVAEAI